MAGLEVNPLVQQQIYRTNVTPPQVQPTPQVMAATVQPRLVTPQTPTLTAQATPAAGNAGASRDTRSGTESEQAVDTSAGASRAQTAGGKPPRGSLLNLLV
jgi:hypothetical protein